MAHRALGVASAHDEREVHVGGAEGDHHHVHVPQGLEDPRRQAGLADEAAADEADDGHPAQHLHLAERCQVLLDAGGRSGSSTVREIETSEVAMRSTGVRCRSNTSKTRATKP